MASAENSVKINVTFRRQEHQLSLSVRPSLELSDFKVDAAEGELDQALRRAFSLEAQEKFYLHEAVSGRILSKETFRDPGYCDEFPRHWYLVVEHHGTSRKISGDYANDLRAVTEDGRRGAAMNHSGINDYDLVEGGGVERHAEMESSGALNGPSFDDYWDELPDGDDVMFPSLMELSDMPDTRYQSHTLQCDAEGEYGFTLRHFTIQPKAGARSDTPQSGRTHSRSDSMASSDSYDSFTLTTTFIYHISPGGVAEEAGLEVGLAVQQINGESILRSSGEEIQGIIQQCGKSISLLVLPRENDDLQQLYSHYTYGDPGRHMTEDGLMYNMDIPVIQGMGDSGDHTPLVPNNHAPNNVDHVTNNGQSVEEVAVRKPAASLKMTPPTGLVPFEDDLQDLSLGVDNLHTGESSGDFPLLSLHEMVMNNESDMFDKFSPHNYHMSNGEIANNSRSKMAKGDLEFSPANLDLISENAPANHLEGKWYQESDDPYLSSLSHSLAQDRPGKIDTTQSSASDFHDSSQPVGSRPRTRSQSSLLHKASSSTCSSETHLLSGGRAGLTGSMSALDYLSQGKRSHSTDLGNIRIKRKGRNSLEALTKIGGDLQPLRSESMSAIKRHRSDENTRRIKPQLKQRSTTANSEKVDKQDQPAWMKRSPKTPSRNLPTPQANDTSGSNTQLSGSDHHGSAPRLSSIEGKGRRARSYQSQRAKLHSSRSTSKISGSQDLSDSLEHKTTRYKRSNTSLEGSASQDQSIQSDETLIAVKSNSAQPVQHALPVVQVEKHSPLPKEKIQHENGPTRSATVGRQLSLREAQQNSSVMRWERKGRPLSAIEDSKLQNSADSTHDNARTSSSNLNGKGQDTKIPLYKTRSAQTPYGTQVFREVNIEEAIARSQMTQEGAEPDTSTFEPIRNGNHGIGSKRKEFGRKSAKSVDYVDGEPSILSGALSHALRLSTENLASPVLGGKAKQRAEVKCHGLLNKKLDLTELGKRASDRSWKAFYAVLAGSKLCFYKDKRDAMLHKQSDEPPIEVVPSTTSIEATSKKKFVFRIVTAQGAEYLLQADDAPSFSNWVAAIQRMNIGQTEMSTPQRLDSSNRLAPNSPLMQRRSSSPQPLTQKTKKKDHFMNRIRRVLTGQKNGDEPDSSSFVTFGQSLEDCPVSADNKRVPLVVEFCVREVEEHGLEVEGIYRKPGQSGLIKSMSVEMDKGNYELTDYGDIHTIGSLLKKFFKELPDPAIPVHLYDRFVACAKESDEEERLNDLKELVYQLPTAHYHTVKYLMKHLKKVARNSDENKMTFRNVSIVFGPTLLFKPDAAEDVLTNMNASYTIVQLLCQHVDYLFGPELCAEEQRLQEEATEMMKRREEEIATRGSPTISRQTEKEQRLAKASPKLVRRIKNNLGSTERMSANRLQFGDGMKRNSLTVESGVSLQPKQPNWSGKSKSPARQISDERLSSIFGGGANPRPQPDRRQRLRRPHVYEDVESPESPPMQVMPVLTDSHARTRSWVESHNERLWAKDSGDRSESAEGHRRGDRHGDITGSLWAVKNREGPSQTRERSKQPKMTRLGRGHLPTAYAPPPMTVESDIIPPSSFQGNSRTSSLPNARLPGMGGTASRRITPPSTSTTRPQGRSNRISYGMAVGVSPVDIPDKDIPMREPGRGRREMERSERLSSSDQYSSRVRSRTREGGESWQTDGYGGSMSHAHQGHTHGMYTRQYSSLQRQVSPPQHHYSSSRRSSESSGDGYGMGGGAYMIQDPAHDHYPRYGSSHGGSRGRIVPQRTFSNDHPHQRMEGAGPPPIPNRESYL